MQSFSFCFGLSDLDETTLADPLLEFTIFRKARQSVLVSSAGSGKMAFTEKRHFMLLSERDDKVCRGASESVLETIMGCARGAFHELGSELSLAVRLSFSNLPASTCSSKSISSAILHGKGRLMMLV